MREAVLALLLGVMSITPASAKDTKEDWGVKVVDAPVDKVYAAAVQVASTSFNLHAAIKEAYTVNFFTGGRYSYVLSAICHEHGDGKTLVTLSVGESVGNPQLFGVGKEKAKLASRFWADLEAVLKMNEQVETRDRPRESPPIATNEPATVTVKSVPDGADISVDGKFSGNTPSTLHLAAGDHKLRVTSRGFKDWERTVAITAGATVTINATLEADPSQK